MTGWESAIIEASRMMIRQIVENEGYSCPEMCSPEELLEADK